jgi:hypothetical protein
MKGIREDASQLRQKICELDKRRSQQIRKILMPMEMIAGSLYPMERACGNPRCRCSKTERHRSWYLSRSLHGRTKLTYIGRETPNWIADKVQRYQRHQKLLAEIRKADHEISVGLNQIRDQKLERLPEKRRRRWICWSLNRTRHISKSA